MKPLISKIMQRCSKKKPIDVAKHKQSTAWILAGRETRIQKRLRYLRDYPIVRYWNESKKRFAKC